MNLIRKNVSYKSFIKRFAITTRLKIGPNIFLHSILNFGRNPVPLDLLITEIAIDSNSLALFYFEINSLNYVMR